MITPKGEPMDLEAIEQHIADRKELGEGMDIDYGTRMIAEIRRLRSPPTPEPSSYLEQSGILGLQGAKNRRQSDEIEKVHADGREGNKDLTATPLEERIQKLEAGLKSIAANGCCDSCQEAKLVALDALSGERSEPSNRVLPNDGAVKGLTEAKKEANLIDNLTFFDMGAFSGLDMGTLGSEPSKSPSVFDYSKETFEEILKRHSAHSPDLAYDILRRYEFLRSEILSAPPVGPSPMELDPESERKAFEAWYSEHGRCPQAIERDARGSYLLMQAVNAWTVWQARAALKGTAKESPKAQELEEQDECSQCGAFGTDEDLAEPTFHESNCPQATPVPEESPNPKERQREGQGRDSKRV